MTSAFQRNHVITAMHAAAARNGEALVSLARAADETHDATRLERLREAELQFETILAHVKHAIEIEAAGQRKVA